MVFRFFVVFGIFISCIFAHAKTEKQAKLDEAFELIKKAMVLVKEVSVQLEDETMLTQENFEIAIDHVRNGRFEEARKIFVAFSKADQTKYGSKIFQAYYWIGYCFFREQNYDKAMFSLLNFVNNFGKSEIFASSEMLQMKKNAYKCLVKCFEVARRPADAVAMLECIKSDFPDEEEYVNREKNRLHIN